MLFPCRFAAKLFMGGKTYKERGKEMKEKMKNIWFASQGRISMRRVISSAKSGLLLAELMAGAVLSAFHLTAGELLVFSSSSQPGPR